MTLLPRIRIPLSWVEWLGWRGLIHRPRFLCVDVSEAPLEGEIKPNLVYREVRKSYPKWAHFVCPRCGEHIQVPIAASAENWRISVDWLNRPTLAPSIWETETCGAHFVVQRGNLLWCSD
jgi:hypothetical protein